MTPAAGRHLIGGASANAAEASERFRAVSPRTGQEMGPEFPEATPKEVDAAVAAAGSARATLSSADPSVFADLLEAVAGQLETASGELLEVADQETAIGTARLTGELSRTTGQLRLIGSWVRSGEHLEATIDHADPSATPPQPDLRRLLIPLGPVAVFGASNFPLAFGVAGGDTASALGAGCPVVVKAHPGHPATSELAGRAVAAAVSECGLPAGTFSLLHGSGTNVGAALVTHPGITAVGFTGSLAGGRALYDLAAQRPEPIPVYAEMGSVNPLLVTGGAIRERGQAIADGLATSLLLGTGQFCTSPGLIFVPIGTDGDQFVSALVDRLEGGSVGPMLTRRVLDGLRVRVAETQAKPDVWEILRGGDGKDGELSHPVVVLVTTASAVAADPELLEEHFGPVSLVVRYHGEQDLLPALKSIRGTLTFTVHAAVDEPDSLRTVSEVMAARAGRIIWNGYPTGVAVAPAMHHGGPYPATTSSLHTSVGTTAVRRFQRPVAHQNAPGAMLPAALRDENPLGLIRRVDGHLQL
jgi:NADP-dependent aldehyde dehydrogenase